MVKKEKIETPIKQATKKITITSFAEEKRMGIILYELFKKEFQAQDGTEFTKQELEKKYREFENKSVFIGGVNK